MMLNIFELNKTRDASEIKKYEIYRTILNKIYYKIKYNSKKNISEIVYIVPNYIVGLPAFDQIKCANYCVDRLRKNGFVIIYTFPNLIFISWDHVPSKIKNPDLSTLEFEFKENPYKDYSNLIYNISNISQNSVPKIKY